MTAAVPTRSSRRVFVAGASGVLGRVLCRLLVQDGWTVVGTTRSTDKAAALRSIGVDPVVVDVFDQAELVRVVAAAAPDVVVHQLTDLPDVLEPGKMAGALERNARIRDIGTRNLVRAATRQGVARLVAQSIAFAYAPGPRPYTEDAPLNVESSDPVAAATARGVASLEAQVLGGAFHGVVLRYGRLYGPGTWFDAPPGGGAVHVDAAADAARRALTLGDPGAYNVAEGDGDVSNEKAVRQLGWDPGFRAGHEAGSD